MKCLFDKQKEVRDVGMKDETPPVHTIIIYYEARNVYLSIAQFAVRRTRLRIQTVSCTNIDTMLYDQANDCHHIHYHYAIHNLLFILILFIISYLAINIPKSLRNAFWFFKILFNVT